MFRIKNNFLQRLSFVRDTRITQLLVICLIISLSILRIYFYGDPNLSIASNDTQSYIEASQVPLFSSEMLTGRRLLTTNLIYKAFEPKEGYQILLNGSIGTSKRVIQPGFNKLVTAQIIMSIIGWGLLAFQVSENIKSPFIRLLSAVTILCFAFTPQMADWDSILLSESFTFSLFALQLALLTKLIFAIYKDLKLNFTIYIGAWAIVYFLWTFLRDTNLFTSFVTIGMIAILLFFAKYRKSKYLYGMLSFLSITLILGLVTSSNSARSLAQMVNIYNDDLLRNPASLSTLEKLGMPAPDSAEYQTWFEKNSVKTLIKFMFIHPGYPTLKILKDFPESFNEIKQTYFKAPEQAPTRELLMDLGNALHSENTTPFLLDMLLLFGLILLAAKNANETSRPWAWLGMWLFLTASVTLVPTILGDTWALNRHALFSTMIYRLFMWIFSIIIIDIALEQSLQNTEVSNFEN